MKKNWLTTLGGILGGVGVGLFGLPFTVLTYYAQVVKNAPPEWFNGLTLPLIIAGAFLAMVGNVIVGVAAKGQDEHSTVPQVSAASLQEETKAITKAADNPDKISGQ